MRVVAHTLRVWDAGDAAALAATAPFPMKASLLQHLQQENKWQREQLREMQKQVRRPCSHAKAVTGLW